MKKRRTLIIAVVLIATLCIGIGYAGFNTILSIRGTASTTPIDMKVVFSAGDVVEKTDRTGDPKGEIEIADVFTEEGTTVSPKITNMLREGDKVVLMYTIKNYNEYAVTVAKPTLNAPDPSAFTYTLDWADDEATKTIDGEDSLVVTVTITLKTPAADSIHESFVIAFNAYAGSQS